MKPGAVNAWWPSLLFVAIVLTALAVSDHHPLPELVANVTVYAAFAGVGAWIALNSGNRMGRLFQALAIVSATLFLTESYLENVVPSQPPTLPPGGAGLAMVWANQLLFVPFFCLNFVFPFVLFPTGKPSSPRWSWFMRLVVLWMAAAMLSSVIGPELELENGEVANPLAIDELAGVTGFIVDHIFDAIALSAVFAVASLFFRYRAADGEQRAQIRWFLFAGSVLVISLLLDEVVLDALPLHAPGLESAIELSALLVGLLGLPVATGIAILKYRLYEIDVVINKTLVYASLTAILAGVYGGLVMTLQGLLSALTSESDIVIAAATLAVAGLFRPLRDRVQAFIDRRFYRRKYDAAKTLEAFSARLRDEVDLDALSAELVAVVKDALQPTHASLWVRTSEGAR